MLDSEELAQRILHALFPPESIYDEDVVMVADVIRRAIAKAGGDEINEKPAIDTAKPLRLA